jgi:trans-aconitate methyltransferase
LSAAQPADRVLEIGFGPGIAIAELADRATRGHVYGIDHSQVMVQQASQPRGAGANRDATARAAQDLHDLLSQAGYARIRIETLDLDPPVACALAVNANDAEPG